MNTTHIGIDILPNKSNSRLVHINFGGKATCVSSTVVILSGIFCLFYSQVARSAEVKVVNRNVFVETDTYEVQFVDGVITQLHNKLTGGSLYSFSYWRLYR